MKSFTNAHSHIFTVNHAPDYFLKTAVNNTLVAKLLERWVQKKSTRVLFNVTHWVFSKILYPNKRDVVERYIEFVKIGSAATQRDVYDQLAKTYVKFGQYKIIVLTQVLDYLDVESTSNHIRIQTQVEQVAELKRNALYQNHICPFLGLDARQTGINLNKDWVEKFISKEYGFYGIKIYPAAGFFPFDECLDPVWKWAEANNVPVMTHCTRSGSFYLGRIESIINGGGFQVRSLNPTSPYMASITERISNVMNDTSIRKKNKIWCNVFGHPDNYRPILEKYPKLKICLAHLGGATEINRVGKPSSSFPSYLQDNWYEAVIQLMKDYENVYADISYTLADKEALEKIVAYFRSADAVDKNGKPLINKLMYGTDFYLTQQEPKGDEPDLQTIFLNAFNTQEINTMAYENTNAYLTSAIHNENT